MCEYKKYKFLNMLFYYPRKEGNIEKRQFSLSDWFKITL